MVCARSPLSKTNAPLLYVHFFPTAVSVNSLNCKTVPVVYLTTLTKTKIKTLGYPPRPKSVLTACVHAPGRVHCTVGRRRAAGKGLALGSEPLGTMVVLETVAVVEMMPVTKMPLPAPRPTGEQSHSWREICATFSVFENVQTLLTFPLNRVIDFGVDSWICCFKYFVLFNVILAR